MLAPMFMGMGLVPIARKKTILFNYDILCVLKHGSHLLQKALQLFKDGETSRIVLPGMSKKSSLRALKCRIETSKKITTRRVPTCTIQVGKVSMGLAV